MMFKAPPEKILDWYAFYVGAVHLVKVQPFWLDSRDETQVVGQSRWLKRVWDLVQTHALEMRTQQQKPVSSVTLRGQVAAASKAEVDLWNELSASIGAVSCFVMIATTHPLDSVSGHERSMRDSSREDLM